MTAPDTSPEGRGVPVWGGGAHGVGYRCPGDGRADARRGGRLERPQPRGHGGQDRQPGQAGGEAQLPDGAHLRPGAGRVRREGRDREHEGGPLDGGVPDEQRVAVALGADDRAGRAGRGGGQRRHAGWLRGAGADVARRGGGAGDGGAVAGDGGAGRDAAGGR